LAIQVRETLVFGPSLLHCRIVLMDTKNGYKRILPINSILMESLKGIVRRIDSPYVFCDVDGRRYLGGRILKTFNAVCKRAGLIGYHFHDLRHTYASHLVMAGVNIIRVSRLMGHKSLTMTLRYSHLAKEYPDTAVNLLVDRMNGLTSLLLHNPEKKGLCKSHNHLFLFGWGARDRTWECRNQNPMPYRLATPHHGWPVLTRRVSATATNHPLVAESSLQACSAPS